MEGNTGARLTNASNELAKLSARPCACRQGWGISGNDTGHRAASPASPSKAGLQAAWSSERSRRRNMTSGKEPGGREAEGTYASSSSSASTAIPETAVDSQRPRTTQDFSSNDNVGDLTDGGAARGQGVQAVKMLKSRHKTVPSQGVMPSRGPRQQLINGSRDDSFLSTISEATRSTTGTPSIQDDSGCSSLDIEVFSDTSGDHQRQVGVLADFRQLYPSRGEEIQHLLKTQGWEKPLSMQRRLIPLVMHIFQNENKSFVTVQGTSQSGKTSALALGLMAGVGTEPAGIRTVVLSTTNTRDFGRFFSICADVHPAVLECFESASRKVPFEMLGPDPESAVSNVDPLEDLERLSSSLSSGCPVVVFGHPARVLPLLREAPSRGVDLGGVQVLAIDDAEETIRMGLMDEVCEVCTILRHFARQRLRHVILSQALSHEAQSMVRCLRNSLMKQQNLFGIRAQRTQARARSVNHYYAAAPRDKWPCALAALHQALCLPSGIIFDDASPQARAEARDSLRAQGVSVSVWNALQEQGSGARAAAREGARKGPSFHIMPSDLVVLKVDLPQVRCVLHFEVPRRELSIYGLRLMCLENSGADKKKSSSSRKGCTGSKSLSILFVEEVEVVRELERTFGIQIQHVPTDMLVHGNH